MHRERQALAADAVTASGYRPEIDGLRAIAVLVVIFFHAGFEVFGAGFLGVDIFFVVSGFLITSLILQEQADGRFSLAGFYARRVRRLLPALLFVMVVVGVVAAAVMTRSQRRDLFASMAATAVFGSNFFLAASTGYFDAAAELRPLLHTWSLAVEEQYYLLFPLLLIVARPLGPKRVAWLLAAIAIASLAASEYGWRHHAALNFYLAPSRAWELLAGALGGFLVTSCRAGAAWPRPAARELLAATGLVAVLSSLLLLNRHTPSPSASCLALVAGTVLMLLFGERDTITGRVLSWPPLVRIGLISYSAYLWHQPVFAFARIGSLELPSATVMLALIAVTLALAALSWRWVEQPVRQLTRAPAARVLRAGVAASAALAVGSLAALQLSQATAVPPAVLAAFRPPADAQQCFDIAHAHKLPSGWYCTINPAAQAQPTFVLYGDSHSVQLLEAFTLAARRTGRTGIFAGFSACPPLPAVMPLTRTDQAKRDCAALNQRMYEWAGAHRIKDVFLVAKWSYYTNARTAGYSNPIGLSLDDPVTVETSRAAFSVGAARSVAWAVRAGTRLHVIAQVPQQPYPPAAVYERAFSGDGPPPQAQLPGLSITRAQHEAAQAFPNSVWRELSNSGALRFVTFDDLLCDRERCLVGTASQSFYLDRSHLSRDGALRLVAPITRLLQGSPD